MFEMKQEGGKKIPLVIYSPRMLSEFINRKCAKSINENVKINCFSTQDMHAIKRQS